MKSTNEVEKKIKAGHYDTKAKQGKSDIWTNFSVVKDKGGNKQMCKSIDLQQAQIWQLWVKATYLLRSPQSK